MQVRVRLAKSDVRPHQSNELPQLQTTIVDTKPHAFLPALLYGGAQHGFRETKQEGQIESGLD